MQFVVVWYCSFIGFIRITIFFKNINVHNKPVSHTVIIRWIAFLKTLFHLNSFLIIKISYYFSGKL